MGFPNKLVYDIRVASAHREVGCRVNDNTLLHCKPEALPIPLRPLKKSDTRPSFP